MWTDDLFGTQKPIISMLHLDPLPGSPRYSSDSSVSQVVEHAKRDLAALQEGGVDGIIVSNEFDLPYGPHRLCEGQEPRGGRPGQHRMPSGYDCRQALRVRRSGRGYVLQDRRKA